MNQILKIIISFNLFLSLQAKASFEQQQWRYLSGFDLITTLSKNFPGFKNSVNHKIPKMCITINSINRDSLGIDTPALGKALIANPNPALIRWINTCVSYFLKYEFTSDGSFRENLAHDYFSTEMIEKYQLKNELKLRELLFKKKWAELSIEEQKDIIKISVQRLIGPPEVLASTSYTGSVADLIKDLHSILKKQTKPENTVVNTFDDLIFSIILRDEFLRY